MATDDLATRFFNVMESLDKLMRPRIPREAFGHLSPNQVHMLHAIQFVPGITQKELAARMRITPAAVSQAIRDMEDEGFLERCPSPDDARQMRLELGKRGKELLEVLHTARQADVADLLSALPLEEQIMIVEALERALTARQDKLSSDKNQIDC